MKVFNQLVFIILVLVLPLFGSAGADQKGTVQGVIEGPHNTLLADAEVSLTGKEGGPPLVTRSDEEGEFLFERVPAGEYILSATLAGFQDVQLPVTVGSTAIPHMRVKMKIGEVSEKVTVSADTQALLAGENKDAFDISNHLLMNLPSKSGDYLAIPSLFVDNSMIGAEGVKVIVDGVEVSQEDIPVSSVKDIAVNRNPFSAEFGRPGKGRVEITTKKGVHSRYRGDVLAMYRNSDLYTREAFATTKPFQERKVVEGEVDGPVPFLQRTTFFISGRYRNFGDQTVIDAVTPAGRLINNFSTPTDAEGLLGRLDVRFNEVHKATFFFRYKDKVQDNLPLKLDLPEHSTANFTHGLEARVFEYANFSTTFLNQVRLGYKFEASNDFSSTNQPSILVLGAFNAGGAQLALNDVERRGELEDVASLSSGRHLFRFGGGVRERSFRATDSSNFGGTFTFSSIASFLNKTPFLYGINSGNPNTSFSWTENYLFFQDDIPLRHNLAFFVGIREEYQSNVSYAQNLGPRLALAYSPGDGKTVIRAGFGIFYDRIPSTMILESRLYNGSEIRQTIIHNPGYPNPFSNPIATSMAGIPSVTRLAPDFRLPYLANGSATIERKLAANGQNFLTLELATIRGVHLFRLRNVNAPFPGTTLVPDPNFVVIDQYEPSASSRGYSASLSYRGQFRKFQVVGKYTLARTRDSASAYTSLPANNYDANADWGRANYDRRQVFNLVGLYNLPKGFTTSIIFNAWSSLPYNITTGFDNNGDTVANDRPPGIWRNAGRGPDYFNIDMRLSRRYRLAKHEHPPTVEWSVDAFNILNHINYDNYIGVMTSPFFGRANGSMPSRQLQLSVRFSF